MAERDAKKVAGVLLFMCGLVAMVFSVVGFWGVLFNHLHWWALAFNVPIFVVSYHAIRDHLRGEQ